jgi:ABC-type spermidine/putrescine transport system permease subunit II
LIAWTAWGRIAKVAMIGFAALVLLYLVMPTFVIVPMSFSEKLYLSFPPPGWSFRWYEAMAERADYPQALWNSIKIGLPVALFATTFGTLAALGVVRGRFIGARPMSALVISPLMLPQIILAIGLYPVMAKIGLIGTYAGVVIGHTVICIPLVFITVAASLKGYHPAYEYAAMTLGAGWWRTFWFVTFPMIRVGVIVGAILSFTFSFDELIIALFLTSPGTRTLPRLLWEDLRQYVTPIIAAATTLVLCISFALFAVLAVMQRRLQRGQIR